MVRWGCVARAVLGALHMGCDIVGRVGSCGEVGLEFMLIQLLAGHVGQEQRRTIAVRECVRIQARQGGASQIHDDFTIHGTLVHGIPYANNFIPYTSFASLCGQSPPLRASED